MKLDVSLRNKTGIYLILALDGSRRFYIGSSSVCIYSRWKGHRDSLRNNRHENPKLQNYYNKYGEQSLRFATVQFCEAADVLALEQMYLDTVAPYFNINKDARSPASIKRPPEFGQKISKALKGRVRTPEHRANISAACKGRKSPNKGVPMSEAQKKKLSELASNRRLSQEHKDRIRASLLGRPSPTKGTTLSEEHKEKLRVASTGKKHTEEAKLKIGLAHKGRKHSVEHIEKWKLTRGNYVVSEETKRKLSVAGTGRRHSDSTKAKMAEARRRYYANLRGVP